MRHSDGRVVTVPVHPQSVVGRGLLRKILRDAELTPDDLSGLL
jgi:predicted RNA binding protein YcfA (HicA-like mRNA interferase family)